MDDDLGQVAKRTNKEQTDVTNANPAGSRQLERDERWKAVNSNRGDLVRVKSGGPVMTVEKVGITAMFQEEAVWCVCFEKVGNKQIAQEKSFSA